VTDQPDAAEPPKELPAAGDTTPAAREPGADHGSTLTLAATAERLGVSVRTVRRMATTGKLAGAYLAPGKFGETWQIPVATVEQYVAGAPASTPTGPPLGPAAREELTELREKVQRLERDLELQRALADERRHQLEQLHMTMRMLTAGQSQTAPEPNQRRRWWKAGKQG
jgi:excisionase family DNA binding protein